MISLMTFLYFLMLTIFVASNNPLLMALILILLSLLLFFITGILSLTWFGMAILLIFSGGMMIIFLYMTSLCSNFKFNIKFAKTVLILPFISQISSTSSLNTSTTLYSISYIYNSMNFSMLIFVIIYLIFTLLFVVPLSQFYLGSLKKTY